MTESPRVPISNDYPDAKRCRHVVRLAWAYPGVPDRRTRIRCKRRLGHAGHTHVGRIERWDVPNPTVPVWVRWVA